MGYISDSGKVSGASAPGEDCVVVFAATSLDPEPIAAALTYRKGAWLPLSAFVPSRRLAELQSEAFEKANGELARDRPHRRPRAGLARTNPK